MLNLADFLGKERYLFLPNTILPHGRMRLDSWSLSKWMDLIYWQPQIPVQKISNLLYPLIHWPPQIPVQKISNLLYPLETSWMCCFLNFDVATTLQNNCVVVCVESKPDFDFFKETKEFVHPLDVGLNELINWFKYGWSVELA